MSLTNYRHWMAPSTGDCLRFTRESAMAHTTAGGPESRSDATGKRTMICVMCG